MKPKVVQMDRRGQIVIPKSVRKKLNIEEGTAFWIYEAKDGVFLKKIEEAPSPKSIKNSIKGV